MQKSRYIVGVDEVGRGPLAGPVTVCAACVPADFDWDMIPGVTDSKKLTARKREEIFKQASLLKKKGMIYYAVFSVPARQIDKYGIVPCIKKALHRALDSVEKDSGLDPMNAHVKLDGGLAAHERFVIQETVIKGDQKEKSIGLASIIAKVTRDRYMQDLSKDDRYVHYEFASHKGYGSRRHRDAILRFGPSDMDRLSFCSKLLGE